MHAAARAPHRPLPATPPTSAAYAKWEGRAAAEGGLWNVLLGHTCFTHALGALGRECSRLDGPQRTWLAIQFTSE